MRLELSGSLIHPEPSVIKFDVNGSFDTQSYIDIGYTHFEVICIGGGGGMGGGVDGGSGVRPYGGAGGGGGFQRVRGLLSALPTTCPIVIGAAGTAGTEHVSNPALTTNGGDGGASIFNTTTCRASGGKGGKRAQSNSNSVATLADGGDGGIGNRIIAGGGADGGVCGTPTPTGPGIPGTAGADGTIFSNIGKGGGGGAGGVGTYGSGTNLLATAGGRGSYNPGDTSVYGPGGAPTQEIVPGIASGAKASPLNGLPTVYGRSGQPGVVVMYLTADVIVTPPPITVPGGTPFGKLRMPIIFTALVSGQSSTPPSSNTYGDGIYSVGTYVGTVKTYGQVDRIFTFGSVVSGIAIPRPPTQTPVAQISLASHGVPSARIQHNIKIRARTLTGSTGVIKAALYEGSTNRSGDLTSTPLTNSLTDYRLDISDAAAATITDYSNLTIRLWGYDPSGNAIVFEVANVLLNLPTTVSGGPKQTPVAEISLASHGTPSQRIQHSIKIRARTTSGSTGVIKAALYEGSTNRSGDLTSTPLTNSLAEYILPITDVAAASITSYANLGIKFWGYDSAGNALVFEVANVLLNLPTP